MACRRRVRVGRVQRSPQPPERSSPTPLRVLLASQEANAAALLGDHERARLALRRAEEAAHSPLAMDSGLSPWSCPRPRQALYALSVAIQTNNSEAHYWPQRPRTRAGRWVIRACFRGLPLPQWRRLAAIHTDE
jgi:hypothetical protein